LNQSRYHKLLCAAKGGGGGIERAMRNYSILEQLRITNTKLIYSPDQIISCDVKLSYEITLVTVLKTKAYSVRDCLKIMANLTFSLVKDYIIENLIGCFHFMSKSHPFYYQNGRQAMIDG